MNDSAEGSFGSGTGKRAIVKRDHGHIALTYVTTCYFDGSAPSSLRDLLEHYAGYPAELLDRIQFVVVDDGSPMPPEASVDLDLNLLLLRVTEDIAWNLGGARNLGIVLARSDKVLVTDFDYLMPEATLRAMVERRNPGCWMYKLRCRRADGTPIRAHPNTFFCSRGRFLRFHGYDEEFAGHYGFEDSLFWRWQRYHGTRFRYLPRRFHATVRPIDPERGYHALGRDLEHNRPIAKRKRREMLEHGPERGHSRAFLCFPWAVVLDRARSTPPPVPRHRPLWARLWWLRFLFPPY
jgi:hypothetical protein